MPDQLFEGFTDAMSTVTPLPPSEVRRRGDRRRRRNQAAVAFAGVAAAAAIVTPVALTAGGGSGQRDLPVATDTPTATTPAKVVTEIPQGFPITDGMGGESGIPAKVVPYDPNAADGLMALHVCVGPAGDNLAWDAATASDALLASWSDGIEGGEFRTLATYPDEATASAIVQGVAETVTGCAKPAVGERGPFPVELGAPDLGDETYAYVDQYLEEDTGNPDGSGTMYVIVREGNALLLLSAYTPVASDPAAMEFNIENTRKQLTGVVAAMESTFGG